MENGLEENTMEVLLKSPELKLLRGKKRTKKIHSILTVIRKKAIKMGIGEISIFPTGYFLIYLVTDRIGKTKQN